MTNVSTDATLPPPHMLGVEGAAFHPVSAAALRESAAILPFDARGVADAMPPGSLVMPSLCGIALSHKRRVHRPASLTRAEREARRKEQRCRFVHFGIDVDADDTPAALLAHYYGPTMGVPIIRVRTEAGPWAHNYNAGAIDEDDLRANDDATDFGGDSDDALSTISGMTARSSGGSSHGGADADDEDGADWLLSDIDDEEEDDQVDAAAWARARQHLAYPSRHGGNLSEEQMAVAMRADAAGRLAERHFESAQNDAAEAKLNEREVARQRVLQRLSEVRASKRAAAKAGARSTPLPDSAATSEVPADGPGSPSGPQQQSSMPGSRAPSASATPLPEPVPLVLAAPLPKEGCSTERGIRSVTSTPLPRNQHAEEATPDGRRASRQESLSAEPSPTPCRSCPSPEPAPLCDVALGGPVGSSRDERSPPTPQTTGSAYVSGVGSPTAAPSQPTAPATPPGLPLQENSSGVAAAPIANASRRRRLTLSTDDVDALTRHFDARVHAHCARNTRAAQPGGSIVLFLTATPNAECQPAPCRAPASGAVRGTVAATPVASPTPAASAVASRRPSRVASAAATPAGTPPPTPAADPASHDIGAPILPALAAGSSGTPHADASTGNAPSAFMVDGGCVSVAAPGSAGPNEGAVPTPAAESRVASAPPNDTAGAAAPTEDPSASSEGIKQGDDGCCIVA